jgi:hypothetical protein
MNKIIGKLARQPNEYHEFEHNGQIKALAIDLGIESQFAAAPIGTQPTCQAVHFNEHETHFILVVRYSGYEDPKENGYRACCLPKSKYSIDQFVEFSKKLIGPSVERVVGAHAFWSQPGSPKN